MSDRQDRYDVRTVGAGQRIILKNGEPMTIADAVDELNARAASPSARGRPVKPVFQL